MWTHTEIALSDIQQGLGPRNTPCHPHRRRSKACWPLGVSTGAHTASQHKAGCVHAHQFPQQCADCSTSSFPESRAEIHQTRPQCSALGGLCGSSACPTVT